MNDLTEKWKKGELQEGFYYVRDGENMIAEYLDRYFYNNGEPMTSFTGGVDEVLAPVPSYDEWKQMNDWCDNFHSLPMVIENAKLKTEYEKECHRADELEDSYWKAEKENARLKELLKECRDEIDYLRKHYKGFIDHFKNNTILDKEINEVLK